MMDKLRWEYSESGKYWVASRPMGNGSVCDFIYIIYDLGNGEYMAEAENNGYGARRVAVERENSIRAHGFRDLEKLKKDIEERNILWLYIGACNCIGKVTKEEY